MKFIKNLICSALDSFSGVTGTKIVTSRVPFYTNDKTVVTLKIPGYQQTDSYSCAFVAGMMCLHYFKPWSSMNRFYRLTAPDSENGTPPSRLIHALRQRGISVGQRRNLNFEGIAKAIDAGKPIITTIKVWGESHWVVLYGYGRHPNRVLLAGMLSRNGSKGWGDFRKIWEDIGYGLVCSLRAD